MTEEKKVAEDDKLDSKDLNFIKENSVFIYGDFDDSIAKDVIPGLIKEVEKQKTLKNGVIKFYINSSGGDFFILTNLLAIIEDAKKNGVVVETYSLGKAYSCASILCSSGSKGRRFISYLSENLAHLGNISSGAVFNDKELERGADRARAFFDRVRDLYRKYANIKDLDRVIHDDNFFMRGQTIIDNGLADLYID